MSTNTTASASITSTTTTTTTTSTVSVSSATSLLSNSDDVDEMHKLQDKAGQIMCDIGEFGAIHAYSTLIRLLQDLHSNGKEDCKDMVACKHADLAERSLLEGQVLIGGLLTFLKEAKDTAAKDEMVEMKARVASLEKENKTLQQKVTDEKKQKKELEVAKQALESNLTEWEQKYSGIKEAWENMGAAMRQAPKRPRPA